MRSAFMTMTLAFAICLVASAAMAQNPEQEAKIQDIKRLLEAVMPAENFKAMINEHIEAQRKAHSKDTDEFTKEYYAIYFADLGEAMTSDAFLSKLREGLIPVYDKAFTHDEIKELVSFAESPVGRKLVKSDPERQRVISQMNVELGMEIAKKAMAKVQQRRAEAAAAAAKQTQEQGQPAQGN